MTSSPNPRNRIAHSRDTVAEAAWWLSRWVSGSMQDPDWDDAWTTFGIGNAFDVLHDLVGNARSCARPVLWRHLALPEGQAEEVCRSLLLPPNTASEFQSFSRSRDIARLDGPEIAGLMPEGFVSILVSVRPEPSVVMFGMADLKASRTPEIRDVLRQLDLWHHQDEVILRVTSPLGLLGAEIIPEPKSGPTAPGGHLGR